MFGEFDEGNLYRKGLYLRKICKSVQWKNPTPLNQANSNHGELVKPDRTCGDKSKNLANVIVARFW